MATLKFEDFDKGEPQRFYLLEASEEMEAMADATLVAEDIRLPVHTQVLSTAPLPAKP